MPDVDFHPFSSLKIEAALAQTFAHSTSADGFSFDAPTRLSHPGAERWRRSGVFSRRRQAGNANATGVWEMDRRSFVVAFAGLSAAAGSAFAQTNTMAAMGPMPEAEKKHILDTLQIGTMSLEASRLAVSRAKEANVKQFANFEVAEQETAGGILKPLAAGGPPVDPVQAGLMKKLEGAG